MQKPLKQVPTARKPANYGRFIENGRAYLITTPDTPRPWCNVLGNDHFAGLFSQCGQGFVFNIGFRHEQITNWGEYQYTPGKMHRGRVVFLKDLDSNRYWAGNPQPGEKGFKDFWCRQEPGISEIHAIRNGVEFCMRAFVPPDAEVEIWTVTLRNLTGKKMRLAVVPTVEFPVRKIHWHFTGNYLRDMQAVYFKDANRERPTGSFFACDRPVKKFDASWAAFYGLLNDRLHPQGVERGLSNSVAMNEWCVGALEFHLELAPGKETIFNVYTGRAVKEKDVRPILAKYRRCDEIEKALVKVRAFWARLHDRVKTDLPDPTMQYALNCWSQFCVDVAMRFRQQAGVGIRDMFQYCRGYMALDPKLCREKIMEPLPYQYAAGNCIRMYDPHAGKLQTRDARDNITWLADSLAAYLKETGDWTILKEVVPYYDKGKGTVWEHLRRATDFMSTQLGDHKQALVMDGDWNDGLRISGPKKKGESTWLTIAVCRMLRFTAEIARRLGEKAYADKCLRRRALLADYVNKHAWDGKWYIYGFDDNGRPVGSSRSKEGKIFANVNTWAFMEDIVPEHRKRTVWKSLWDYIWTDVGALVQHPAFTLYDENIGPASSMTPGAHENAGAYSHGSTFFIAALAAQGMGAKAAETWHCIHPTNPRNPHSGCEPYGSTTFYTGAASPRFGASEFSWFSGSAAWMFFVPLEMILGVKPDFDGLRIDPCIPGKWKRYRVMRKFRSAEYDIEVRNPRGVEKGVREVRLDGRLLPDNLVPPAEAGRHKVDVLMG
jgi:cellobiose phosphorylase